MRILMLLFMLSFTCLTHAAVFQSVDAEGDVSYSDVPAQGAVEVATPAINQVPSTLQVPPQPSSAASNPQLDGLSPIATVEKMPYNLFLIESPADNETVQNQPIFTVKINVEPKLQSGDKIQLMLDGKPVGKPEQTTELPLTNVNRGQHQLYAVLLDEKNNIIKRSNEITIFVHRASIQNPTGAKLTPKHDLLPPMQRLNALAQRVLPNIFSFF